MNPSNTAAKAMQWTNSLITDGVAYWIDRTQRSVLFWDTLRQRGNTYWDHLEAGQPPVLVFDYEMVMDGRTFEQPVNYSLVRIVDRRQGRPRKPLKEADDRRSTHHGKTVGTDGRPCRPIVIIDPRAGHGPGIGGSKFNSQVGVAIDYGHPVYFILFYTEPEPGQTIARVQQAEIRFLEEVVKRHSGAPKPAVIGNCQGGWAAALAAAERPDVVGPLVLNGSPLSYWGGTDGSNPMRYRGGLVGGVWMTSLWCDLGGGRFDGAHLVAGFEDLNPANTYWSKLYHLFSNVDGEAGRFLNFERWWGGFYLMNTEEIHFIVDGLFIGNELEKGHLKLDDQRVVDLKNIQSPILVFASSGDNITPPPQALNWIYKVYGTVDEIKRHGQVIVYMVHEDIGHLGIFVSGKVAQKEHHEILGHMGWLEYLTPGLYEMVIDDGCSSVCRDDYQVRFEARDMDDLLNLDDGLEDEAAFEPVHRISRMNDVIYRTVLRPWVRLSVTPGVADGIRNMHPMRLQRSLISDRNPLCLPLAGTAEAVKEHRRPAAADNVFATWENLFSESLKIGLDYYRDMRDLSQELLFKSMYDSSWMKMALGPHASADEGTDSQNAEKFACPTTDRDGYVEACIRVMIAVAGADRVMDAREFETAERLIQQDPVLREVRAETYKNIVKEQACIMEADAPKALAQLAQMVPDSGDRERVRAIAKAMASADSAVGEREQGVLTAIEEVLSIA